MNRLGLKGKPAPQPQRTLLSSPKKRLPWEVVMLQLRYKVNKITSHFALHTKTGYSHV